MSDYTISDRRLDTRQRLFSDITDTFLTATLTLSDGSVMHVSQYPKEFPQWGVDSYFGGNGFPHWCHGSGERGLIMKAVNEDVEADLNRDEADWESPPK